MKASISTTMLEVYVNLLTMERNPLWSSWHWTYRRKEKWKSKSEKRVLLKYQNELVIRCTTYRLAFSEPSVWPQNVVLWDQLHNLASALEKQSINKSKEQERKNVRLPVLYWFLHRKYFKEKKRSNLEK